MRTSDLFRLALSALWKQKTRTALTMLGVVLGACMLAFSLSIGEGVKEALQRQFRANDDLRRIQIYPGYGENADEAGIPPAAIEVKGRMSEERRQRIRRQVVQEWHNNNTRRAPVPLTAGKLDELARIEHVATVIPSFYEAGRLNAGGKLIGVSVRPFYVQSRTLPHQIIFGAVPPANNSRAVLIHEWLLYQLGIRDDAEVAALIGKPIRLEINNHWRSPRQLLNLFGAQSVTLTTEENLVLEKAIKQLPSAVDRLDLTPRERELLRDLAQRRDSMIREPEPLMVGEEFTLAGVYRSLDPAEEKDLRNLDRVFYFTDVLVPYETGRRFCEQLPRRQNAGYDGVTIMVDREENVRPVVDEIKTLGLQHFSPVDFVEHILREIRLINYATTFIAGVALLVAGIGITNTMVTSVLERIQEIGIMKAVGAKDRHIQTIFLVEGALIGLAGGLLGLLFTYLMSIPGDGYARKIMEEQTRKAVEQDLFVFPSWLVIAVPVFSVLITTVAAFYPARRAAKVDPITALRYE